MTLEDVLRLPEGPRRTAAIAAWVQSLFGDGDPVPVLVGGAAIEILTGGAYTTGDLDFVGFVPSSVRKKLEAHGFRRSGRHWINDEAKIFIEFPRSTLGKNERSIRRDVFGYDLVLVSVEDLLVDRLGSWEYWRSGIDGANALALYRRRREEIDKDRLAERAREAGFEAALAALRSFDSKWADSEPDNAALEEWANRGPGSENS